MNLDVQPWYVMFAFIGLAASIALLVWRERNVSPVGHSRAVLIDLALVIGAAEIAADAAGGSFNDANSVSDFITLALQGAYISALIVLFLTRDER
jgi:hypothetical protein